MAERYKMRFPDLSSLRAALAHPGAERFVKVRNEKRLYIAVELADQYAGDAQARRDFDAFCDLWRRQGAELGDDPRYDLELPWSCADLDPDVPGAPSLPEVLTRIHAPDAWATTRGAGVVIAIVDTGVALGCDEFPREKRIAGWAPEGEDPWTDTIGHGTMVATVAAGTRAGGGRFDGVAPDAGLISCRTNRNDTELAAIYDFLTDLRGRLGLSIVTNNSFGAAGATAPPLPPPGDFPAALAEAIAAGIIVCFSAGNNHDDAPFDPAACEPTTIWERHKCRDDVLTVGASDLADVIWAYSSRGPGRFFGEPGTARKPDVVAPTPRGGRMFCGPRLMSWPKGWGTSGTSPQVAGLAALIRSAAPRLSPDAVRETIRTSAASLGAAPHCQGAGLIDCAAAVHAVAPLVPVRDRRG